MALPTGPGENQKPTDFFQGVTPQTEEELILAEQLRTQDPLWKLRQSMAAVMCKKGSQTAVATYHQLDITFAHFNRVMKKSSHQPIAFDPEEKPFNKIIPEEKLFNEIFKHQNILPDGNVKHDMDELKKPEIN